MQFIQHSPHGKLEVLAQASDIKAGCGATGNCVFLVFQKTPTEVVRAVCLMDPEAKAAYPDYLLGSSGSSLTPSYNSSLIKTLSICLKKGIPDLGVGLPICNRHSDLRQSLLGQWI